MSKITAAALLLLACCGRAARISLNSQVDAEGPDFDEQCASKVPGSKALSIKRSVSSFGRKEVKVCECADSSEVPASSGGRKAYGPTASSFKWDATDWKTYRCMPEPERAHRQAKLSIDMAMQYESDSVNAAFGGLGFDGDALSHAAGALDSNAASAASRAPPEDFDKFACADRPNRRQELDAACADASSAFAKVSHRRDAEAILRAIVGLEAIMSIQGYDEAVAALAEVASVKKRNEKMTFKTTPMDTLKTAKRNEFARVLTARAALHKFVIELKPMVDSKVPNVFGELDSAALKPRGRSASWPWPVQQSA